MQNGVSYPSFRSVIVFRKHKNFNVKKEGFFSPFFGGGGGDTCHPVDLCLFGWPADVTNDKEDNW